MNFEMLAQAMNPEDNRTNQVNPNKGTPGTNKQYDKAQGNRGKQLNPNQQTSAPQDLSGNEMDEGDVFWHDSSD